MGRLCTPAGRDEVVILSTTGRDSPMRTPQGGIFALGTASHAYLEFDVADVGMGGDLVAAIASLREPRTTMGGVDRWQGSGPSSGGKLPGRRAPGAVGFNEDLIGIDGFVMPAVQHDAVLWLSGTAYDVVFECARGNQRGPRAGVGWR